MSIQTFVSVTAILEECRVVFPDADISQAVDSGGLAIRIGQADGNVRFIPVSDRQASGYYIADVPDRRPPRSAGSRVADRSDRASRLAPAANDPRPSFWSKLLSRLGVRPRRARGGADQAAQAGVNFESTKGAPKSAGEAFQSAARIPPKRLSKENLQGGTF